MLALTGTYACLPVLRYVLRLRLRLGLYLGFPFRPGATTTVLYESSAISAYDEQPGCTRCQRLHLCTRSLTSLAGTDCHQTSHAPERCVTRAIQNCSARGRYLILAGDLCPELTESMSVLPPEAR